MKCFRRKLCLIIVFKLWRLIQDGDFEVSCHKVKRKGVAYPFSLAILRLPSTLCKQAKWLHLFIASCASFFQPFPTQISFYPSNSNFRKGCKKGDKVLKTKENRNLKLEITTEVLIFLNTA